MTIAGRLVILEPWVPDDQVEREVVVVGRSLNREGLVLVADVPLCWDSGVQSVVMVVFPRHEGVTFAASTHVAVNGALWQGKDRDVLHFVAQLDLEDTLPLID